ncbi:MAG: HEAT repeat domain-containing protein, partial [Candidatus Eisenbacteria bacterium]
FALAVAIGRPAIDLACSVMALALKSRTRAAACTMLCYLCSDSPELLARYLGDTRWFVVRNVVFVLGQIGGAAVVPLLEVAARHPEPRVRHAVVTALGNCPGEARVPLLLAQLESRDPQVLATSLHMLGRTKSPQVARAILKQIEDPSFARRAADSQRSLFNALADCGDDEVVPGLETLLHKGGWFAQPTLERTAAARTLARIGTESALAALEIGLRAHREAVRHACLEALNMKAS